MRLLQWSYSNLIVPMIEQEDGTLATTGPILCTALGIDSETLIKIGQRNASRFSWYSRTVCPPMATFLQANRELFGIKRLKRTIRIWSDADMVNVAFLSNSPKAADFRDGVIELIRQHARKDYVSPEVFEQVTMQLAQQNAQLAQQGSEIEELRADLAGLRELVSFVQPSLSGAASAAGTALQAQRALKKLRN